jgi:hypothetical protein
MQKVSPQTAPKLKGAGKRPADAAAAKRLLKLAQANRPPQSWFDQDDRPFEPAKK